MNDEKETLRAWVENWNRTGKILEELRREEIRNSNLAEAIESFDLAFKSALWLEPVEPSSGLTEYHKILSKWR